MNGDFSLPIAPPPTAGRHSGSFPVNYPNTWLRLNRVGNVFTGFGSYDGTNWTQLGTATIAMPAQIYLGLAVASHNTNQPTTAQFVDYETTPANAVVATHRQSPRTAGAFQPQDRHRHFRNHVEARPAHRRQQRGVSGDLQFLSVFPGHQQLSSDLRGHELHLSGQHADSRRRFFVLAASPQGIANVYGLTSNVFGPYNGSLKHSETLELLDEQSNVLLTVPYTDVYPWPVAADGTGHSIVLANPTYGEGDPRAWDISDGGRLAGPDGPVHPQPVAQRGHQ
jgi:hypothetical protein